MLCGPTVVAVNAWRAAGKALEDRVAETFAVSDPKCYIAGGVAVRHLLVSQRNASDDGFIHNPEVVQERWDRPLTLQNVSVRPQHDVAGLCQFRNGCDAESPIFSCLIGGNNTDETNVIRNR